MSDENSETTGLTSCSGGSSLTLSLIPPTFDECVFQPQLFAGFMKYLVQLKANENLLFIKHATLFSMLNRPLREKYLGACKIIWNFICDSCPSPVNVSAETRNKLIPVIWRLDGITLVNNSMFDEANTEIKFLLAPMFNEWIKTNEWQRVPFFHAPPPTISTILRLPSVRSRFESFLDERREEINPPASAETDYKMFQTCIQLFEVIEQTKSEDLSNHESERKARHFLRAHKSELQAFSCLKELEMPKLQHKRKHGDSGGDEEDDDIQNPCLDFIHEALDTLSEELMDHECYEHFVDERSWNSIDVLKTSLQQTLDQDGYAEDPTLSGILHSPTYGPLIMESLKGTDKYSQLTFLIEAQDFYNHYSGKKKMTPQDRKEMQTEARKIYETHFSKSDLDVPKRIKSELMKVVHSPTGRLNPLLFQTAGAWLFNKISRSWIREANSLRFWADHDFDNHSTSALEMDMLYNITHISGISYLVGENLNLVPHPDDILGNPQLLDSFHKFVPQTEFNSTCFLFMHFSKEAMASPQESRVERCEKLFELLNPILKECPELIPIKEEIEGHFKENKEVFSPMAFMKLAFLVARHLMFNYYTSWVNKCKPAYKAGGWQPVKNLTFIGGNAVPGTTWIPTLGVSTEVSNSLAQPTKKKWGLRKLRNSANGSEMLSPPSPIIGKKTSYRASTNSIGVVVTSPKEDLLLSKSPHDSSGNSAVSDDEDRSSSSGISASTSRNNLDKLMDAHALPIVVPRNVPDVHMEVPTLLDTLSCTHLRRLFYSIFLEYRLGDGEKKLWNALCKFHSDFSSLTDAEVFRRQKDIREAALKVLQENPEIPDNQSLVKAINDSTYNVSSRFFFDAEVKLYGTFHNNYESFLAKNQWVRY